MKLLDRYIFDGKIYTKYDNGVINVNIIMCANDKCEYYNELFGKLDCEVCILSEMRDQKINEILK